MARYTQGVALGYVLLGFQPVVGNYKFLFTNLMCCHTVVTMP